jgi:hypothetical protein
MQESKADLEGLQALLDRSFAGAGAHLRSIFDKEHRLSAQGLVDALEGIFEMHLATLTSNGAPLVAPIDGVFFKGKVWFGLPTESVRSRLVRRDSRISASYSQGSFAFIVHGSANEFTQASPVFEEFEFEAFIKELYVAQYGPDWLKWHENRQREHGPGFRAWIEPRVMFAKR